jgi:hypothetical protein
VSRVVSRRTVKCRVDALIRTLEDILKIIFADRVLEVICLLPPDDDCITDITAAAI